MKQGSKVFAQGTKWMMGSHGRLNFWFDKWLSEGNVRSLIEGPLKTKEDQVLVMDLRMGGNGDFTNCSMEFLESIMMILKAVPFPTSHSCTDKIVWATSPSGSFEPKSADEIATGTPNWFPDFEGKRIWRLDSLPKVKAFIWKCYLHSIPTKEVLLGRRLANDAQCQMCNNGRESIMHILRDCSFAKVFWDNTVSVSNIQNFFSLDLCDWLTRNLELTSLQEGLVPWNLYFPLDIWNLWIHRNNFLFKENHPNPSIGKAVSQAAEKYFFRAARNSIIKSSKLLIMVRWNKPSNGWVKLNTDGSALGNPGRARGGGLIRDSDGQWVKGFTRNIGYATKAELWALRDELTLCLALNTVAVEIKIDAAVVFDWITNDSTCNLNHSSLIMNCGTLAGLIPQVKICHCFGEANKCADALARKGPSIQQDFIVFYSLPVDIAMLFFSDFSVLIAL